MANLKAENSVIVRSDYDHDHSIKVKSAGLNIAPDGVFVPNGTVVLSGKQHRGKNITIIPKETWEEMKENFFVKNGIEVGMLSILPKVPDGYFGAIEQVAMAKSQALEAKKQLQDTEAELTKKQAEIEELKRKLINAGLS